MEEQFPKTIYVALFPAVLPAVPQPDLTAHHSEFDACRSNGGEWQEVARYELHEVRRCRKIVESRAARDAADLAQKIVRKELRP